ncbi:hypothetical protein D9M71_439300 [compost metagenome]
MRPDCRQGAVAEGGDASAAVQADGFGRFRRGVFQGFGKQPAEHASGMQGQGQGAGVWAEAGSQHHQRCPDQFRHGTQGVEHQPRATLGNTAEAAGGGDGEEHPQQGCQQGAQGRHGEGFHGTPADGGKMRCGQVGLEEARRVAAHLLQGIATDQRAEIDAQPYEGSDRRRQQGEQHEEIARPHANLPRRKRLSRSARNTRRRKVNSMLATSPPANMRMDRSICWPRPPAPTNPITTEARTAHSQR